MSRIALHALARASSRRRVLLAGLFRTSPPHLRRLLPSRSFFSGHPFPSDGPRGRAEEGGEGMHAAGHIKHASVLFEDEKLTVAQFNLDGNSECARVREQRACSRSLRKHPEIPAVSPRGIPRGCGELVEKRGTCPRSAVETISGTFEKIHREGEGGRAP